MFVRVTSYFYNSILKHGTRQVLVHFFKHGFEGVVLTLCIMAPSSSIEEVILMEQYFLDKYFNHPLNLNKDNIASGSGKSYPMSEKAINRLRKERGKSFFVYDLTTATLLHIFESKTFAQLKMHIDHRTLNDCLTNVTLYLGRFVLTLEILPEMHSNLDSLMPLEELTSLIDSLRIKHRIVSQSSKKSFIAINIQNPSSPLAGEYNSINEFAKAVDGDRSTIRDYINGNKPLNSLYRND